ncbi:MAG: HAMP domain-containing histidine kinase, partial [Methylococcales bacterium]|nr:HAMP domain-containing histidine kinase [Methylococcales bacterium]
QHQGGTGLGLAISYNLVKAYQGSLSCQSTPEEGTIFALHFPAINT